MRLVPLPLRDYLKSSGKLFEFSSLTSHVEHSIMPDPTPAPVIPVAIVQPASDRKFAQRWGTRLWIVTALCLIVAIGLTIWAQKPAGPTITIHFKDGFGIRPGNTLQHHGIEVGEVTSVTLEPAAEGVAVKVLLQPQAAVLASEGAKFWIVRPNFSLTRVSGLETVVGAKYIGVQPGPINGKRVADFKGQETPLTFIDSEAVEVEITFHEGHGLAHGDPVKHRGIVIGEVTAVDLGRDLNGVVVRVRLSESASHIARTGTQFWVERPTINVAEVRGLDTLVSGRYVAMQPGPSDAPEAKVFVGLDVPPPAEVPEGGIEIVLEAARRGGLQRGVPLLYRGMRVGHVITVGLANDAVSVEARAWIDGSYKSLVRANTRFWMNDGFDLSVGLKGVKLSTDTLSSLLIGGVSLATPEATGEPVRTGQRFACADKPEDEWLNWKPRVPLGHLQLTDGGPLPKPLRAAIRWHERVFGFQRERQRTGWVLPLQDGRILGPTDLFEAPPKASDQPQIEAGGAVLTFSTESVMKLGSLTVARPTTALPKNVTTWPLSKLGHVAEPVDCLVIEGTGSGQPLSISAARIHATDDQWTIDPTVPLTADHHGAVVVAQSDYHMIGLVTITNGRASISRIPASLK